MNVVVNTPAELGAAVRRARHALGVSQEVLAAGAGVGVRFVVELEAGKPTVQLDRVLAVLASLELRLGLSSANGPADLAATPGQAGRPA